MTLKDLAERWVAIKNTARPSPNTASARVSDLWAIGQSLAGTEYREQDKLGVLENLSPANASAPNASTSPHPRQRTDGQPCDQCLPAPSTGKPSPTNTTR